MQDPQFGGWGELRTNVGGTVNTHDGKMYISLPQQCTLVFEQTEL